MTPPPALQQLPIEGPYSQRAFALWCVEQLVPRELLRWQIGPFDLSKHIDLLRRAVRGATLPLGAWVEHGGMASADSYARRVVEFVTKTLTASCDWRWTTTVDVFEMALAICTGALAAEAFAVAADGWAQDALRAFGETAAAVQAEDFLGGKQHSTAGHAPDQLGHCGCESCRATRDNLTLDNELFREEDD